ncbi:MAG TPA: hypothetical protein VKV03_18570, partial [Candidatus Binataceae bacterium]|nr:hypothetical protein [Candidatus Binataceae bacterium]
PAVKGLSAHGEWSENSVETGEFLLGYENQLGQLTRIPSVENWNDPSGYLAAHPQQPEFRAFGLNGTYLVFRKLQQDVEGFWSFVNAHSPQMPGLNAKQQRELFAAKMIGRWRSGAPLALSPDSPGSKPENKFLYMSDDPDGLSCPIGAHIRRANPRDSLSMPPQRSLQSTRRHRIIRRGRSFCEPARPFTPKNPQFDRGLYFIALNANLRRQFEFIQQSWLNDPGFNGLDNDADPIAGGNAGKGQFTIQDKPLNRRISGIQSFVTVKGGGYFFLPSIRALKFLAHWQG